MLNKGQIAAKKTVNQFLLSDQKAMCLIAPSGYGKSFLIDDIIADLGNHNKRAKLLGGTPINTYHTTAPTNKAAAVLNDGQTIHTLLGLNLLTNYDTGVQSLKTTSKTMPIRNGLVFVDEASMINRDIKKYIDDLLQHSKVVYVGDDCQLPPPKELNSAAFNSGYISTTLTKPMRQDPDSDLFKLCEQLRETVKTGIWKPLEEGEGIKHLTGSAISAKLGDWFHKDMGINDARCITFQNHKSISLNRFIRPLCGFQPDWSIGDLVTTRNSCFNLSQKHRCRIDESFQINNIEHHAGELMGIKYCEVDLNGIYFKVAYDQGLVKSAMDIARKQKAWREFYTLKENLLDMRSAYSCTGHSSQGSTFDKVYVDLSDMAQCREPEILARLLYVAVSRARTEVVFNGSLPRKLWS